MTNTTNSLSTPQLLRDLAHKLGLPLPDLVASGLLPDQIAQQMETNCSACPRPEKCAAFLADHPDRVEKPPSFCVNGRLLTFLAKNIK